MRWVWLVGLLMLALVMPATALDLNDGLVAYYSFDNIEGNVLKDDSGNGHDGTIYGNPKIVDGIKGKALEFDGVDDRIKIPHETIDGKIDVTAVFWIKTSDDVAGIISGANDENNNEFLVYMGSGGSVRTTLTGMVKLEYFYMMIVAMIFVIQMNLLTMRSGIWLL